MAWNRSKAVKKPMRANTITRAMEQPH